MKKVVPIVIYRHGSRYVVAEASVELPEGVENVDNLEVNITEPQLTMISDNMANYSIIKKE